MLQRLKPTNERDPETVAAVEVGGVRTMFRRPDAQGGRTDRRRSHFTARKFVPSPRNRSRLVTNFAAQAVIAIENARLLNELRQSLGAADGDRSRCFRLSHARPAILQPVFATMLENATRICEAKFGTLYLKEGDGFRATATHNAPPAYRGGACPTVVQSKSSHDALAGGK